MSTPNDLYQAPLYNGIGQSNEYSLVTGVCILPLAEDPPTDPEELANYSPVIIARLHAPYRIRKYNSIAPKQNNPPVVPSPIDQGAFIFTGGVIQFVTKLNNTGLAYDWIVNTGYTFVENCVSRLEDGFVLGSVMPYTTNSDQAGISAYGQTTPTIGAISSAGPNAIAGYNLGNLIAPLTDDNGPPQSGGSSDNLNTGMSPNWIYNLGAFFPGNFFNDQLVNGGGV